MAFTDMEDLEEEQEEATPAGRSNRNFWLIFGILGGILVLSLACVLVYALVIRPQQIERANSVAATDVAMATEVAFAMTQTDVAKHIAPTRTPTNTPLPVVATRTSVIQNAEITSTATSVDEAIATRNALLTLAAELTTTPAIPTSTTTLPDSGFADEVGVPGLLGLALVFVVVIFLVRRMRASQA